MQPAKRLRIRYASAAVLILWCLIFLNGCAALKEFFGFVTKVDVSFEVSHDVNLSEDGKASPIVVRMFEFEDVKEFKGADFFSLFDKEAATIGQFILAKDEFEFRPGDQKHVERKTKPETKFIGIFAAYRDLDNAKWRAVIPLDNEKTNEIIVHLGSAGVQISKQ